MVHAEAADFKSGQSKEVIYKRVLEETRSLLEGQRNWVCNLANAASLLWYAFKSMPGASRYVNWAGFYVLDPRHENQLILGPFQGKVACQTIAFGKGVCGVAAEKSTTQLVPDVDVFPGHIACDGESASEIVVPIVSEERVVAIIDVDCAVKSGFDNVDQAMLQELAHLLAGSCDW